MIALPLEKLGGSYDGGTETVDRSRVSDYAAATNDPYPGYELGLCAPPLFGAVLAREAVRLAVADMVPAEALPTMVHGEHDVHFRQPLLPGASLATRAQAHSVRVGTSGTSYTVLATSADVEGEAPVLDQYFTVFLRGVKGGAGAGPDKPVHTFPTHAQRVGQAAFHVDGDRTFRYAPASGDDLPVHVDDQAARRAGLPAMVVHGLRTLAMATRALLDQVSDGDPLRLKRLAARFAANVFPGDDVVVGVHVVDGPRGRRTHPFQAFASDGAPGAQARAGRDG